MVDGVNPPQIATVEDEAGDSSETAPAPGSIQLFPKKQNPRVTEWRGLLVSFVYFPRVL